MCLRSVGNSAIMTDEYEMLGIEGDRRSTGVPNISSNYFLTDKNILSNFSHPSSYLSCKNIFIGVLQEDDQHA